VIFMMWSSIVPNDAYRAIPTRHGMRGVAFMFSESSSSAP
jgi:hypothetical protein